MLQQVSNFIDSNILHSEIWDNSSIEVKEKAVNNAIHTVRVILKRWIPSEAELPVEIVAHQTIWLLQIDDTFRRADMGITYIQMAGVMVTLKDKDRSINPIILDILGISPDPLTGGVPRRKVASYVGRRLGTETNRYRIEQ